MSQTFISRRNFLQRAASPIAASCALPALSAVAAGQERAAGGAPDHIVLCIADDLGWHETGYQGHALLRTPVLDGMAARGLRFGRFYSGAALCAPTRGSVMTGRNANRFGDFAPNWSIRPEEITVAALLRKRGYVNGYFGKWHLGPVRAGSPTNPGAMGFDEWLAHDNFYGHSPLLSRNGAEPRRVNGESSEGVAREAVRFLKEKAGAGKRTFTVLAFGSPHEPYTPTDDDIVPYHGKVSERLAERFAEISAMDRAMGYLRDGIREAGIAENTLVWFISDNGTPVPDRDRSPLRGAKGSYYEGGIRVPAIVEWPARIRSPRRTAMRAVTSDILPTLCELTGATPPERPLDGISLRPLFDGTMEDRPGPICFWGYDVARELRENPEPYLPAAAQTGNIPTAKVPYITFRNLKHPRPRTADFGGVAAITEARYKLYVPAKGPAELYDLEADDGEKHDLAASQPERVKAMRTALEDWQRSVERSLSGADYRGGQGEKQG
ncbi:MAG: sulfatase-like hydrolase/transferase [Bryobacterales bacterium]|nr:sulfatase-like hydrolase/transferase [Bryobacterales bacterium]